MFDAVTFTYFGILKQVLVGRYVVGRNVSSESETKIVFYYVQNSYCLCMYIYL